MNVTSTNPTPAPHRHRGFRLGAQVLLWSVALLYALPLLGMLIVSAKSADDSAAPGILPRIFEYAPGISQWTGPPTVPTHPVSPLSARYWPALVDQAARGYRAAWSSPNADFPLYLQNSLLVAILSGLGAKVRRVEITDLRENTGRRQALKALYR